MLLADRTSIPPGCSKRDALLTAIGLLQLRVGDPGSAQQSIEGALESAKQNETEASALAGFGHFLLGSIANMHADHAKAVREFTQSVSILKRSGPSAAPSVSRAYQDLALTYFHERDLSSGEAALQSALRYARMTNMRPDQAFVIRDTLLHIRCAQGRRTEAENLVQSMIEDYGENKAIASHRRAHLYSDAATMSTAGHRREDAIQQSRKSLALLDPTLSTPEYALALTTLAQAYDAGKRREVSKDLLAEAYRRSDSFQHTFPADAARISVFYGKVLCKENQWSRARMLFLSALSKLDDVELRRNTLRMLVEADHQLHQREEEASTRRELKALVDAEQQEVASGNTVDVLDFNAAK